MTSQAADSIAAYVDRIIRMRSEAKAINGDIREIYAEAKGNGFDKTILGKLVLYVEKREIASAQMEESEALFDLYLSAYDSATGRSGMENANAHMHEAVPHDAETGEINEPAAAPSLANAVDRSAVPPGAPVTQSPHVDSDHGIRHIDMSVTSSAGTEGDQTGAYSEMLRNAAHMAGPAAQPLAGPVAQSRAPFDAMAALSHTEVA